MKDENTKETAENETEQKQKEEQKEVEEQEKKELELKIETEKNESKPPIKRRADFGKPHNFKSKPKINKLVKTEKQINKEDSDKENEDNDIDIFNNKNKSDNNQMYIYIGIFIVGMMALLPIIVIFLKKDESTNTGNNPGWKPIS